MITATFILFFSFLVIVLHFLSLQQIMEELSNAKTAHKENKQQRYVDDAFCD